MGAQFGDFDSKRWFGSDVELLGWAANVASAVLLEEWRWC